MSDIFTFFYNILQYYDILHYKFIYFLVGTVKSWECHERMPAATVREVFTRFLDITTPPSTKVLKYLVTVCNDENEANYLRELIEVST